MARELHHDPKHHKRHDKHKLHRSQRSHHVSGSPRSSSTNVTKPLESKHISELPQTVILEQTQLQALVSRMMEEMSCEEIAQDLRPLPVTQHSGPVATPKEGTRQKNRISIAGVLKKKKKKHSPPAKKRVLNSPGSSLMTDFRGNYFHQPIESC